MENKNIYCVYFCPDGRGNDRRSGSIIYRGGVKKIDLIRNNFEDLANFAKESVGEEITTEMLTESVDKLTELMNGDSESNILYAEISNGKIYMFAKIYKKKN